MRIHILSDIHLEFAPFDPPDVGADVVILAGDIDTRTGGVDWARACFDCPVLYVSGNHEYYGGHFRNTLAKMKRGGAGTNVHVLDSEEIVLEGVRFLAATLWTDFAVTGNPVLAQVNARQLMNDYRRIRAAHYRRLRPADTLQDHMRARRFLEERLRAPFAGKTVVITHHAPSAASIAPQFEDDPTHLNASFVSRLDELIGPPVSLWVHGHTHASFDYELSGVRVVCNARGYVPMEINPGFDPGLVVEV
jgi:predicted phosphodiesterase